MNADKLTERTERKKGKPLERVGRKASGLIPIEADMVAGLPGIGDAG